MAIGGMGRSPGDRSVTAAWRCAFIWFLFLWILVLSQTALAGSFSSTDCASDFHERKPGHLEVPSRTKLPSHGIRILVWNALKFKRVDWAVDFKFLARDANLILLQEALINMASQNFLSHVRNIHWNFVCSFQMRNGSQTGVLSGSEAKPLTVLPFWSPDREPIIQTPKTALLTEYDLEGNDKNLLIANIHGINFTSIIKFKRQLLPILRVLSRHQGPMIFAGDFNTWNSARLRYLTTHLNNLGLRRVDFPDQSRLFILDHVFVRDVQVTRAEIRKDIASSDHKPLLLDLDILDAEAN